MENQGYFIGAVMGVLLAWLCIYLFSCYVLWRIGKKFGIGSSLWAYCVPVYQAVLFCRCAGVSFWYIAGPLLVNIFCGVLLNVVLETDITYLIGFLFVAWLLIPIACYGHIFGSLAKRLGKNYWLYFLLTLPFCGIPLLFLAFDSSHPVGVVAKRKKEADVFRNLSFEREAPVQPSVIIPSVPPVPRKEDRDLRLIKMQFIDGEFAGNVLELPPEGISFGRDPNRVNLVVNSSLVSALHLQIRPSEGGGLVFQDMDSSNGTYYRERYNGKWDDDRWQRLHGSMRLLKPGSDAVQVRLTKESVCSFVIEFSSERHPCSTDHFTNILPTE